MADTTPIPTPPPVTQKKTSNGQTLQGFINNIFKSWQWLRYVLLAVIVGSGLYIGYSYYHAWKTKPPLVPMAIPQNHNYTFDIEYDRCQYNADIENHIERHNYCVKIAKEKSK